ncbi:hypothetical protein Acsp03_00470 [Actinomadura sp. NBRC 104412]|uniref:hypothetical protein n=1 Tax=Actinomadura sp. NBRC 104412 TaxID=3032203 RepID=UPI0024A2FF9D|nr:hypothetical protein [Actinomadura sp. NBRC 104412]GLZ02580.1 hypothetical protein Acsp03_00470 [Actinomadura sp. NBRC 104412]
MTVHVKELAQLDVERAVEALRFLHGRLSEIPIEDMMADQTASGFGVLVEGGHGTAAYREAAEAKTPNSPGRRRHAQRLGVPPQLIRYQPQRRIRRQRSVRHYFPITPQSPGNTLWTSRPCDLIKDLPPPRMSPVDPGMLTIRSIQIGKAR